MMARAGKELEGVMLTDEKLERLRKAAAYAEAGLDGDELANSGADVLALLDERDVLRSRVAELEAREGERLTEALDGVQASCMRIAELEAVIERVRETIDGWPESVSSVHSRYAVIVACREVIEAVLTAKAE